MVRATLGMVCSRTYKRIIQVVNNILIIDENTKDTKITSSSETILHGLKKYTNYSMQVLAFTNGGDGVRSSPIHCQTEQDGKNIYFLWGWSLIIFLSVPEAPSAVKALVMSGESILVSWKPPIQPNGVVTQYTVYIRQDSEKAKEVKLVKTVFLDSF